MNHISGMNESEAIREMTHDFEKFDIGGVTI
jgi:hypothetical protein